MANSKADGSVNFDTKIDTSGFEKGLKQIDKSSEKAAKNVERDTEKSSKNAEKKAGNAADDISKSFAKSAEKMQSSMQEAGDRSEKIFKDTENAAKSAMDGIDGKTSGFADSIPATVSRASRSFISAANPMECRDDGFPYVSVMISTTARTASSQTFVVALLSRYTVFNRTRILYPLQISENSVNIEVWKAKFSVGFHCV